ncbi:MAG: arginine--tRNA ligase [Spirochaetia bacterium]|nr:arginine--tRNA ligase [Spirochaetia bacterium]
MPDDENLFLSWVQQAGEYFSCIGIEKLLDTHKNDLSDFRVSFDNFFSEKSLHENNSVENTFLELKEKNQIYEKDGAWFFKSSDFGDDKDRVIKRNDGRPTYLLADIAYHKNKADRKFDNIYDMWGPDHHGYIARMKAAMQALEILINHDFKVLIVQQVNLIEDKKPIVMSKRLGKFQTMKDLTEKIPVDVCRYFFNTRSQSSHLDFDLELALTESNQNPVYYIQYAHARIHSIFRETTINYNDNLILNEIPEQWFFTAKRNDLLFYLLKFPEELYEISKNLEVHRLSSYLYQTASLFTAFYHEKENHILEKLKNNPNEGIFLLSICKFTADTIAYGLNLLGVSAPQKM